MPQNSSTSDVASALLARGASPNACCNVLGGTALHETAHVDNDATAMVLIAAGADINAKDVLQDTALHVAALSNSVTVATILIRAGAELNAKDSIGETPLHHAAEFGNVEIVDVLLAAGANASATSDDGSVPGDLICGTQSCSKVDHEILEELFIRVRISGLLLHCWKAWAWRCGKHPLLRA